MKRAAIVLKLISLSALIMVFTSCESTDGHASGSVHYGVGYYDPWYYGDYYDDPDMIVVPPDRPEAPVRPSHPIATPPATMPRPTPMPSIPSMPRGGGGGRR